MQLLIRGACQWTDGTGIKKKGTAMKKQPLEYQFLTTLLQHAGSVVCSLVNSSHIGGRSYGVKT